MAVKGVWHAFRIYSGWAVTLRGKVPAGPQPGFASKGRSAWWPRYLDVLVRFLDLLRVPGVHIPNNMLSWLQLHMTFFY